ncbi:hypothetical protein BX600DRAFT_441800 [Xylariales sp. PMI_506]|nr:hypothetical protein BX600DRAFT_441800 [Xylariales sp. PMI_506]
MPMLLLQLPPELLLRVLGYLGQAFFRQDLRRLTVCRQWYDLAWQIFIQHLNLTATSVKRFARDGSFLARSKPYVYSLDVSIGLQENPRGNGRDENGPTEVAHQDFSAIFVDIERETAELNTSIASLAAGLQGSTRLRSLKLKARMQQLHGFLMIEPLVNLLEVGHLTSLVFDTAGSWPIRGPDGKHDLHICQVINLLLPSLHTLRCRMDYVCEDLLDRRSFFADEGLQEHASSPLHLIEVIINLSLFDLSDNVPIYRYPGRCVSISGERFSHLRDNIENQARILVAQCRKPPRMVRVISHELPSLKVHAYDAVTEQRVLLKMGDHWDADGEVVHNEDVAPKNE